MDANHIKLNRTLLLIMPSVPYQTDSSVDIKRLLNWSINSILKKISYMIFCWYDSLNAILFLSARQSYMMTKKCIPCFAHHHLMKFKMNISLLEFILQIKLPISLMLIIKISSSRVTIVNVSYVFLKR